MFLESYTQLWRREPSFLSDERAGLVLRTLRWIAQWLTRAVALRFHNGFRPVSDKTPSRPNIVKLGDKVISSVCVLHVFSENGDTIAEMTRNLEPAHVDESGEIAQEILRQVVTGLDVTISV